MNCENCGKPSENKLCPTCLNAAIHDYGDGCHNCDKPCKPCYDFEDDSTQVYNDLNETE